MWYYALGESEHGPISDDEMQALIASGTVTPTTQVWKEGMAEWGPASGVPGLISAAAPRTAAAAPMAPAADTSAFDASNPYSQTADVGTTADFGSSPGLPYDTFTKVVLIIDTVLCGLQILVQGFSILGLLLMRNAPQVEVGPLMIVSICVIFLVIGFGLAADIMLLRRNRSGVIPGWIAVVLVLLSIVLGVVTQVMQMNDPQFTAQMQQAQAPPGATDAIKAIAIGSMACGSLIRVGILICYGTALSRASKVLGPRA